MANLNLLFLEWWYKEGYVNLTTYFRRFFAYLYDQFSISVCISTLFDVWRRDYQGGDNLSIQERFQAMIQNMVSRFIGFLVKFFTILVYLLFTAASFIFFVFFMIFWLLYPLVSLLLILLGLVYLFNLI